MKNSPEVRRAYFKVPDLFFIAHFFTHSSKIPCYFHLVRNCFESVYEIERNDQNIDRRIYIFLENSFFQRAGVVKEAFGI